jgi:hypothetical protein
MLPTDPLLLATGGILTLLALVAGGFIVAEVLRLIRELLASQPKLPAQREPPADDLPPRLVLSARSVQEGFADDEDQEAVSALIDRVDGEGEYPDTPPE